MDRRELDLELERMHPASWGWALACCGRDRHLAEDVLQSAYARIFTLGARFDGRSSLRSWVFSVIRLTATVAASAPRAALAFAPPTRSLRSFLRPWSYLFVPPTARPVTVKE